MEREPAESTAAAAPARILVVDDELGVREGCRRVLAAEGHHVDTAGDGAEALKLLRQSPYDLVLVDMKMPAMDGLEFLAATRGLELDTVFVVITAYATLAMAVEATKCGAYDFVAKPFTPDELQSVTAKALERVALVRERSRLYEERERRLLELTTEQGRLRSVVEAMSDGLLVTNREGQLVLYNAAALDMTGCTVAAGEAHALQECLVLPELLDLIERAASEAGGRRFAREIPIGAEAHQVMTASARPVTDEAGECLGVVTVLHDVSELKRVELIMAQFMDMVAHELRAPLAAIDSQLVAITQGFVTEADKQHELLERSHQRLGRLLDLVADLLTLSRLNTAAAVRELGLLDLGELGREVCALLEPTAREQGVAVDLQVAADLPPLEGDRQELTTVLTNLVGNAIKYNRPGGTVTVRLHAEYPRAVIEVADTGMGISPAAQQRVFDDFYREKTEATANITGTGLGLAIVRRTVRSYHGTVAVQSEPGVGSTFTVRLPLAQGAEARD